MSCVKNTSIILLIYNYKNDWERIFLRKIVFSIFAASTLFISSLPLGANGQVVQQTPTTTTEVAQTTNTAIQQVSKAKAKKMSGTYKFKYNTNVRANAGKNSKRVTLAKAGQTAKATHQKKVSGETWYKVKTNGKSGWVLSSLVTKQTAKKSTAKKKTTTKKATAKTTKASGKYKLKHNTNVRTNAGTNHKVLVTAKKGSTFNVTHKKKVGGTTWYKAKIQGKTGWVSGDLITKATAKKATAKKKTVKKKTTTKKAAPKATKASGKYKLNYRSNVRSNAGTNHKVLVTANKGTTFNVTHKKKVSGTTWYKAKIKGKTGWVSGSLISKATTKKATAKKKTTKKATTKKTSSSKAPSSLITNAKKQIGKPYAWGARGPSAFDCSGFIQYAFKISGKSVAGTTIGLYNQATKVSSPQVGDLVFFAGTYRAGISHAGIYVGNGKFIHASTSRGVRIDNIHSGYWKNYFHSYGRL